MKLLYSLFGILSGLLFVGCASSYSVKGTTSIHEMEGSMMYLKTYQDQKMKTLDSCTVTHGKFQFKGIIDSSMMANLFINEEGGMPVVLDGSDVTIKMDELGQNVTGGPLNDSLNLFIKQMSQIDSKLNEIPNKEGRMVMDGYDHDYVVNKLNQEYVTLMTKRDKMEVNFIKKNYDNVLGPGYFLIMVSNYPYPQLTPQIEEILTNATPNFLNNPIIKEYINAAEQIQEQVR